MGGWKKLRDIEPGVCEYVLCYVNDIVSGWVELLKYEGGGVFVDAKDGDEYECTVTHWMPLPEHPKDE
jgi:hypothetical protein